MRLLRTVAEVRTALRPPRREGRTIGLVPTMGALHAGHLALVERAREECDEVVVSLFVNPRQFDETTDLDAYPRDEQRDAALVADTGADLLWAPPRDAVYPEGFATEVRVSGPLVDVLEGGERGAAHFHGVTTVVTKLLNVVAPDVAFFGQKDAQQALVVRKLVADLDLPVRVETVPTVREPDGLALSSRNVRLGEDDRPRAVALNRALLAARDAHAGGEHDTAALLAAAHAAMTPFSVEPEYLVAVDAKSLAPVAAIDDETLVAVAARVGGVRLIDNITLIPPSPNGRR